MATDRDRYNADMKTTTRPDVERLPADLDRFLSDFFDSRDWQAEIKFDPVANLLFLDVRLATGRLSNDDRFFSLVEHFSRTRHAVLRAAGSLSFRCRLYAPDGADLTARLHERGSAYLDDHERAPAMRRRLMWLGLRRRLVRDVAPMTAVWTAAVAVITLVVGLPVNLALVLAAGGIGLQALLATRLAEGRR